MKHLRDGIRIVLFPEKRIQDLLLTVHLTHFSVRFLCDSPICALKYTAVSG